MKSESGFSFAMASQPFWMEHDKTSVLINPFKQNKKTDWFSGSRFVLKVSFLNIVWLLALSENPSNVTLE